MTHEPAVQELPASPKLALYAERFYEEITEDQKAEFINGAVVMASPARLRHLAVRDRLHKLLDLHAQVHDLGTVMGEKAMVALTRNDYEPDVCFFASEKAADFAPDQWTFPAPDFVCEVLSPSPEATDRGIKFEDYAAHGVREYWIVDPDAETVEHIYSRTRPMRCASRLPTAPSKASSFADLAHPSGPSSMTRPISRPPGACSASRAPDAAQ